MAYEYKGQANDNTELGVFGDAVINVKIGTTPRSEWRKKTTDPILADSQEIGLITEDGETFTRSVDITTINSHQGSNQRSFTTNGSFTLAFTAQQFRPIVKQLYLGSAVDAVNGFTEVDPDASVVGTLQYDAWDFHQGFERHLTVDAVGLFTPNGDLNIAKAAESNFPLLFTAMGPARFNEARTIDEEAVPEA